MPSIPYQAEEIIITLTTCGAAFEEAPASEIARILRKLADVFEDEGHAEKLYDTNGNAVGRVTVRQI